MRLGVQGVDIAVVDAGARNADRLGYSTRGTKGDVSATTTEGDTGPPLGEVDVHSWGDLKGLPKVTAHAHQVTAQRCQTEARTGLDLPSEIAR